MTANNPAKLCAIKRWQLKNLFIRSCPPKIELLCVVRASDALLRAYYHKPVPQIYGRTF